MYLTLGMHVQEGYRGYCCLSVCVCLCVCYHANGNINHLYTHREPTDFLTVPKSEKQVATVGIYTKRQGMSTCNNNKISHGMKIQYANGTHT